MEKIAVDVRTFGCEFRDRFQISVYSERERDEKEGKNKVNHFLFCH